MKFSSKIQIFDFQNLANTLVPIFFLLFNTTLAAQGNSHSSIGYSTEPSNVPPKAIVGIEQTHAIISNKIIAISLKLDNILGYEEMEDESPNSQVRLKLYTSHTKFDGSNFKTRINTHLALPRTEKRLHLFFSHFKESRQKDDSIETLEDYYEKPSGDPTVDLDEEDLVAGVRQIFWNTTTFHLHTDVGARFQIPIDPYLRIKGRLSFEPGEFAVHFTQDAFAYLNRGYGFDLGITIDRPLGNNYFLRQSNLAMYRDTDRTYVLQHGLNLIKTLGNSQSLVYFASAAGVTEPVIHMTAYNFGLTYRTPVGWPWLIFELTPIVNYPRTRNFAANPGIILQLEARFGST